MVWNLRDAVRPIENCTPINRRMQKGRVSALQFRSGWAVFEPTRECVSIASRRLSAETGVFGSCHQEAHKHPNFEGNRSGRILVSAAAGDSGFPSITFGKTVFSLVTVVAGLRRLTAANEMDDQRNHGQHQENVDRSAGDMECCPSDQPANP